MLKLKTTLVATALVAFFLFLVWSVSVRQALLYLIGIGMGVTLTSARFGFTTGWRQLAEQKDPRGAIGQITLLLIATSISIPLLSTFPELTAALGPPSFSLIIGAFIFGMSMQIADGCGSGTLYKAGSGTPLNLAILPLFALGSFLGSAQLNDWLSFGQMKPVSLVNILGSWETIVITWALLLSLGFILWIWTGKSKPLFEKRWIYGGIVLALLASLNLLVAGQPWGVVYGFGLWAAKVAVSTGWFDPAANPFWGQSGNLDILGQSVFLDVTSITNIGILAGAQLVGLRSNTEHQSLNLQQWVIGLLAGFVMGYSSRLAFGCNIGGMLSGISTGSLHGWIWMPMAFLGTLIGIRLRKRYAF